MNRSSDIRENTISALKVLAYSNTWIAIAAALLAYWQSPDWQLPLLVGLATWARYSITAFTASASATAEKFRFVYRHRKALRIGVALCAAGIIPLLMGLNVPQMLALAHLGLLSIAYIFPVFGLPLRKIPYLKIFLIVYVWTWSTYLLPTLPHISWIGTAERLAFFFAIALPFDINDMADDQRQSLRTIPRRIGAGHARLLSMLLLLASALLAYWAHARPDFLCIAFTDAIGIWLCWKASPKRGDLYFLGAIDGVMVLQGGILAFFL